MNTLNKRNPLRIAVRAALFASAAISATTTPLVLAEEVEEAAEATKITITGSRIPRQELSQPSPVVVLQREELKRFGTSDLGTILSELSAVAATDTLQGNSGSNQQAGASSANLRNLGANRTLTLVNGKRHVSSTQGSAQVDLGTIPINLVEQVEIITGGASAIYGSDAVTGVINVILRQDYEGFEVNIRGAESTEDVGDSNSDISFLAGTNFSDGNGNITFFMGREYTSEVMSRDLQHLQDWGTIGNPNDTGENDDIPDRIQVPNLGSEMISDTGVLNPFGGGPRWTFLPDGTPVLQQDRQFTNSFAFGNFPNGCDTCFFTEDYENFLPEVAKINVGSTMNYEISENVNVYGEFKYVRSDIKQQFQPSFNFGGITINVEDNPYLDADLRSSLLAAGQTTVSMAKFFDEIGNRSADNRREVFRMVAGVNGYFNLGDTPVDYDVYYVNGRTANTRRTPNDTIAGNLTAALDAVIDPATGEVACRSQVPSAQGAGYQDPASLRGDTCSPYNPFGFGAASAAAIDFVSADVLRQDELGQEYYGASFAFDSSDWFELQGGAMGVALGFEHREEFSETITDELAKSGILGTSATPDERGDYEVDESYIEISLPLVSGVTGIEEFTLDGAFRTADYSHAGRADAWKVGLVYAPFEDIRIRGTHGESVRAPDIGEAFSPQSPGFARLSDPCDADNVGNDPDRAANCAALGIPADFQANDNVSISILQGGNPDLTPEESVSTTYGIVWTPSFVENLSVTLDSYDIEISDAIISVAAQTIANNCVDSSSGLDENFCAAVDRDPTTFDVSLIRSGFINASALIVEGFEMDIRYAFELEEFGVPGKISAQMFVAKLDRLTTFEFQNKPEEIDEDAGEIGTPKYQGRMVVNYGLDDLNVSWTTRFAGEGAMYDVTPEPDTSIPEDISPSYHGGFATHDLAVSYAITEDILVNGGIRNVANKLPEGWTRNSIYDSYGRRLFVGATINF